jgi:hypothetical protein
MIMTIRKLYLLRVGVPGIAIVLLSACGGGGGGGGGGGAGSGGGGVSVTTYIADAVAALHNMID